MMNDAHFVTVSSLLSDQHQQLTAPYQSYAQSSANIHFHMLVPQHGKHCRLKLC